MSTEGAGELIHVAAPPGTGKSTVLPHLIALARGSAVIVDIDEVLEDGALLGVRIADPSAASLWPAYDRHWERISALVTRAGFDMVLLVQVPDELPPPDQVTVLGWEIDDAARASRLRGRGEPEPLVADALSDAAALRELLPPASIIRTEGDTSPQDCARLLWERVEPCLRGHESPQTPAGAHDGSSR
ncbi:hypothetical protein GCM10009592_06120 [Brachybacterium rhamnosum]|uniref:Uncharacterized protein n=1 Tax=Brachybacterium rhamnosum TaxID=173361 RepID=A0ABW4PWN6_9MICO